MCQHLGYMSEDILFLTCFWLIEQKTVFVAHSILFQDNGNITNPNSGKITIMVGVAKKKEDPTKKKGELMESNMDAMEVSQY